MPLPTDDFEELLAETDSLVQSGDSKFYIRNHENSYEGRLGNSDYPDSSINEEQAGRLMDGVFKGNFTHLDFSGNDKIDSSIMGVILKRIVLHYGSSNPNPDRPGLLELNIAKNNIDFYSGALGQLLSDPAIHLQTLNLGKCYMLISDMIHLCKMLGKNNSVRSLSLPLSFVSASHDRLFVLEEDSLQAAEAIASMLKIVTLDYLHLEGMNWIDELLYANVLKGLSDACVESLSVNLSLCKGGEHDEADRVLASVILNNRHIINLKLVSHEGLYKNTALAVLQSPGLRTLEWRAFSSQGWKESIFDEEKIDSSASQISTLRLTHGVVCQETLALLKDFPLEILDLSGNNFYFDTHGKALFELINAKKDTLNSLNISGNYLGRYREKDKKDNKSHFLTLLVDVLQGCKHLAYLKPGSESQYSLIDVVKFLQSLRQFHNLSNIDIDIDKVSAPEFTSRHEFTDEMRNHLKFFLNEIQKKNLLIQHAECKEPIDPEEWKNLEQVYLSEINRLLNRVKKNINIKTQNSRLGPWTDTHEMMLENIKNRDYLQFHHAWQEWKVTHGDTESTIDLNLGIFLDWLDETLALYAEGIRLLHIDGHEWAEKYSEPEVIMASCQSKLELVEQYRIEDYDTGMKKYDEEGIKRDKKKNERKARIEGFVERIKEAQSQSDDEQVMPARRCGRSGCSIL